MRSPRCLSWAANACICQGSLQQSSGIRVQGGCSITPAAGWEQVWEAAGG